MICRECLGRETSRRSIVASTKTKVSPFLTQPKTWPSRSSNSTALPSKNWKNCWNRKSPFLVFWTMRTPSTVIRSSRASTTATSSLSSVRRALQKEGSNNEEDNFRKIRYGPTSRTCMRAFAISAPRTLSTETSNWRIYSSKTGELKSLTLASLCTPSKLPYNLDNPSKMSILALLSICLPKDISATPMAPKLMSGPSGW